MTGIGHGISRQSSSRETSSRPSGGASQAHPRPDLGDDAGQRVAERVDVGARGVALQREPDVAVREHAHRLQHVARGQGRGGAGRPARDPEATPVELGHQRLAVDVEAGERHQVGEPVVGVAHDLDVGHLGAHPSAYDVHELVLARVDLVALGHHGLQRGSGREDRGDVLEAGRPLVGAVVAGERVAPPRALADEQHADARGATPLVGRPRCRRPAVGQGQAPHRGARVGEQRDVVGELEPADRLEGADLVVGGLQGGDADAGGAGALGHGVPVDETRPVDSHLADAVGSPRHRVAHGRVLDRGVHDRRPRGESPAAGRAAPGGRRACRWG